MILLEEQELHYLTYYILSQKIFGNSMISSKILTINIKLLVFLPFICIGATIWTRREIQCLLCAGFSRRHVRMSMVLCHWVQFFSRPLIDPQIT